MGKTAVIYWTSTGNTQTMAETFAEAINAELFQVSEFDISTIDEYTHLAFGCPACGEEELDDTEFGPFFSEVVNSLSGKNVALFGSYGWGDGEWMQAWENQVIEAGAHLFEKGQIVLENPDNDFLLELESFAKRFIA